MLRQLTRLLNDVERYVPLPWQTTLTSENEFMLVDARGSEFATVDTHTTGCVVTNVSRLHVAFVRMTIRILKRHRPVDGPGGAFVTCRECSKHVLSVEFPCPTMLEILDPDEAPLT